MNSELLSQQLTRLTQHLEKLKTLPPTTPENSSLLDQILRDLSSTVQALQRTVTPQSVSKISYTQLLLELDSERARLKAIIDNAPEGIIVADKNGNIILTNPAANTLYTRPIHREGKEGDNTPPTMAVRDSDGKFCIPSNLPLTRSALQGETITNLEMAIIWPDDQKRYLLVNSAPTYDKTGMISGAVGIFQDITERKQTRLAIQHYADRLKILHEIDRAVLAAKSSLEIARAALPHIRRLLLCCHANVSLFDLEARKLVVLASDADETSQLSTGWSCVIESEVLLTALQQGEIYIEQKSSKLQAPSPLMEALQNESAQRLTLIPLLAQGNLMGVLTLGMTGSLPLTASQIKIAQEVADQLAVGIKQIRLYEQTQRQADRLKERVRNRTAALRASEARFQAIFEDAAVGIALMDTTGVIMESNPALQELLGYSEEALQQTRLSAYSFEEDRTTEQKLFQELVQGQRRAYKLKMRYTPKAGSTVWANLNVSLIRDTRGKTKFAVGMIEDITEQEQAQAAMIQTEKLALMGRIAGSLAHEINNPLQTVIGCLGLADEMLTEDEEVHPYLQTATQELKRAARIVAELRDLSRKPRPQEKVATDINQVMENVLLLIQKRCQDQHVKVNWHPNDTVPQVRLVPDRIQQVFLNLTLNALDAMPDGGELTITTSHDHTPPRIHIKIADTGVGFQPGALEHLFNPFYTTKPEGVGLGLFTSKNIIEDHGGKIEVQSHEGGTLVSLSLPFPPLRQ